MKRERKSHVWDKHPEDWYVEPLMVSRALFREEKFDGIIYDPACGMGNIVAEAQQITPLSFGSDIVNRSAYCSFEADFLRDENVLHGRGLNLPYFDHIVTNPPYKYAEAFVQRALDILPTGGKAAFLLPLNWMCGFSKKRKWLPERRPAVVYAISPRPSMPPGTVIEAGEEPEGGRQDFAWFVWHEEPTKTTRLEFLNTKVKRG